MTDKTHPTGLACRPRLRGDGGGRRHRRAVASSLARTGARVARHRSRRTRPGGDGLRRCASFAGEHVIARCDTSSPRVLPPLPETT